MKVLKASKELTKIEQYMLMVDKGAESMKDVPDGTSIPVSVWCSYEDEKEDFEPDEADTVELINGERMPWEQVKRDGIDYIALYYVNEKGKPVQILDAELA